MNPSCPLWSFTVTGISSWIKNPHPAPTLNIWDPLVTRCLMMTLIWFTWSSAMLRCFGVTHRWTLGMPIKTFNESGRASKQQSGQTHWNPPARVGPQTAAFGFNADLIHLSVWLLVGKPSLRPETRSTLWNYLKNGWLKMFAFIMFGHLHTEMQLTSVLLPPLSPSLWILSCQFQQD